jgi:hypothetical protein
VATERRPTPVGATVGAATVETATGEATASVEAATARTSVRTSASTTVSTTAMLSKSRGWQANQCEGSDTCKKGVQQGGLPHVNILHPNHGSAAGRQPLTK